MKYALTNSNEIFLKYAFKNGLYPDFLTKDNPERITDLLAILEQGTQVELILNILIYADIENWSGSHLKEFIELARHVVSGEKQ